MASGLPGFRANLSHLAALVVGVCYLGFAVYPLFTGGIRRAVAALLPSAEVDTP